MTEIHVVGAAIIDGSKVFAAQRSESMKTPLKWEFVGGKVEPGETHTQALIREVKEELGVKIGVKGHIATGYSTLGDKRIVLHVYEAELLEGTPTAREHSELKWVDIDRLMELDWAEADLPACDELMRKIF